jgi:Glyoxalase-like domain
LDHLFICTAGGAAEAEKLVQLGLKEGPPNQHPGQGTANRRFAFLNAIIELLWVSEPTEAQSENTARTMLWERWSGRCDRGCPFGICVRPVDSEEGPPPFPGWAYRPAYLPDPLFLHIGEAGIEEPMWVYLSFVRRTHREQWFREHPIGIREITRLTLHSPVPIRSSVSQILAGAGIVHIEMGPSYLLEIEFDGGRRKQRIDFRPDLPMVFDL